MIARGMLEGDDGVFVGESGDEVDGGGLMRESWVRETLGFMITPQLADLHVKNQLHHRPRTKANL